MAATACGQRPAHALDFAAQRQRMVERQLKPRGIKDERVLAAMAKVPREEFVPPDERAEAYQDGPLPHRLRSNHFAAVHRSVHDGATATEDRAIAF